MDGPVRPRYRPPPLEGQRGLADGEDRPPPLEGQANARNSPTLGKFVMKSIETLSQGLVGTAAYAIGYASRSRSRRS